MPDGSLVFGHGYRVFTLRAVKLHDFLISSRPPGRQVSCAAVVTGLVI